MAATDNATLVSMEDGRVIPIEAYWAEERQLRLAKFGKMQPALFERYTQALAADLDTLPVEISVRVLTEEPRLPFDGRDIHVAIEAYESWIGSHAEAQHERIASAKMRVRSLLALHGAEVRFDGRGLPIIQANVPVVLLGAEELHADDIDSIDVVPEQDSEVLGHAGQAAMRSDQLVGGTCGSLCDGGLIDVGLWERDGSTSIVSGLARNNNRISQGNVVTGYLNAPTACTTDAGCVDTAATDVTRSCQAVVTGGPKICVQDHLSWVAASVGMFGAYSYNTGLPTGALDPVPNVPAGTSFGSTGAWRVDQRVGNDSGSPGLDYLVAPPNTPTTPYVNRSASSTPQSIDFVGRTYGTFVTVASGNDGTLGGNVSCGSLRNGLCVGSYNYVTYNDLNSHRRTPISSFINDSAMGFERPHLLGPGSHQGTTSGLHMPTITVAAGTSPGSMQHALADGKAIQGTSFSAPAVLSAAIRAHQYEGWFSALAFPMVNKAVLLASTRDANADGAIGKSQVWSYQPTDAEDGAGQIDLLYVRQVLDGNRYLYRDLANTDFVSCGTNCREYNAGPIAIPAFTAARIALAWQSCPGQLPPQLNNELALVLNCGSVMLQCGGSTTSNAPMSEIEMLESPACSIPRTCGMRIRITNGGSLNACGSTATERVGLAWSFR